MCLLLTHKQKRLATMESHVHPLWTSARHASGGYGVRPHGNQKVGMSERRQRAMPMVGGANLTKGWNDSEEVP